VPMGRVELPCPIGHYALNVARLPFRHLGPIVNCNNKGWEFQGVPIEKKAILCFPSPHTPHQPVS
jgi:hypothetical protein